ncbi:glycosyl transferase [Sphingomonas sp. DBB INV C78]|uniref:glycosyltransferase family 2 protein n=1 Tax=Sphingomonas sp. DBB INV C78 TaxID=3349434 RepID=UPI0036D41236
MPLVSIIVPAFDAEPFIAATLASASAQTLRDIEIIVVDDVSHDRTPEIVAAAAVQDPRIRLIRQPRNGGPSVARNTGIAAATGTWIALLDADDRYEPDRLERMVACAERHDADLVSDNLLLVPEERPDDTRPMIPPAILDSERTLGIAEFVRRNIADPEAPDANYGFLKPLMRRAFLAEHAIRYDESVRFAEDFALYAHCLRAGARWWMMPQPLYRYLVRKNGLTQVQTVHDLGKLRSVQRVMLDEASRAADAGLVRLIRQHMRVVDRCYHYRAFTDDLKARRFGPAMRRVLAGPRTAGLIAEESLRQVPIIAAKALRGGYRSHG